MRHDIQKVVCERQRGGSSCSSQKTRKKLDPRLEYDSGDFDWGPVRASSSRHKVYGWDCKGRNENTKVLRRFIAKAVGRPWNDVFSEICQYADHRSTVGSNILRLIRWIVCEDIIMEDGKPYRPNWGCRFEHDGFYVNEEGILCVNDVPRRVRTPDPVTRIECYGNFYYQLEVHQLPAKVCGCVHFKVPYYDPSGIRTVRNWRQRRYDEPAVCIHGREAEPNPIWFIVEYAFHEPDEVYEVVKYGEWKADRYNVLEGEKKVIYYRDVPHKLAEPYIVSKKTANRKALVMIKKVLESGESRS